jgi:RNA polymerase sigma-70 factor (ECF subfamily)
VSERTDELLIEKALRGDGESFGLLVEKYRRKVFGVAYHMLADRETATDVAQEAFVKAYERLDTFSGGGSFVGWLISITSNLCVDILRRRKHKPASLEQAQEDKGFEPVDGAQSPESKVATEETAGAITEAMQKLPVAQRLAITLRHIEGLSYEEISKVMAIPTGTAKTHVHRGRERLIRMLHRFYPEVSL